MNNPSLPIAETQPPTGQAGADCVQRFVRPRPILKWPGGKSSIAEWITGYIPTLEHYVEPFFGGGAIFFALSQRPKHSVLNDLDGEVVNLFRMMRNHGDALAEQIAATPWSREEYERSFETADNDMERARRFMVMLWQSHNAAGPIRRNARGWKHQAASAMFVPLPRTWRTVPERVLECMAMLADCEIECKPAVEVIKGHQSPDAVIYADPPYPMSTRSGQLYVHEMTDEQHTELLAALNSHTGPVILSGYDCELYNDQLKRWMRKEKQMLAEKGQKRTEVLWLNPRCAEMISYGPLFAVSERPNEKLSD